MLVIAAFRHGLAWSGFAGLLTMRTARYVKSELVKWLALIKEAGIKPE
jgi:hypothetical protein